MRAALPLPPLLPPLPCHCCRCCLLAAAATATDPSLLSVPHACPFPWNSAAIRDNCTLPLDTYGGAFNVTAAGLHPEDHGTSHLSVVDADRWGWLGGGQDGGRHEGTCGDLCGQARHACMQCACVLPRGFQDSRQPQPRRASPLFSLLLQDGCLSHHHRQHRVWQQGAVAVNGCVAWVAGSTRNAGQGPGTSTGAWRCRADEP